MNEQTRTRMDTIPIPASPTLATMPRVSVIIPTYNRLERLKRVLTGLQQQTYPLAQCEIIVVSDGSTDGTNAYLENPPTALPIIPVIQANQGVAATRNHGLHYATGEFVLFLDDDVVPTPALIAEHIHTHTTSRTDKVVLGPMLTPPDCTLLPWVQWEQAMLMKQYEDMLAGRWQPTARQFYTGNTSLARRLLLAAGGFDPTFRRAEDVELAYRLVRYGVQFVFNPRAIGYHYAERSFHSWLEIPSTYGRNDVIFARDKQQDWLLPTIWREFYTRHRLIRLLVYLGLDRYALSRGLQVALKRLADLSQRLGISRLTQMAYSGLFNLRYYQGVADELGGRDRFLHELRQIVH